MKLTYLPEGIKHTSDYPPHGLIAVRSPPVDRIPRMRGAAMEQTRYTTTTKTIYIWFLVSNGREFDSTNKKKKDNNVQQN